MDDTDFKRELLKRLDALAMGDVETPTGFEAVVMALVGGSPTERQSVTDVLRGIEDKLGDIAGSLATIASKTS